MFKGGPKFVADIPDDKGEGSRYFLPNLSPQDIVGDISIKIDGTAATIWLTIYESLNRHLQGTEVAISSSQFGPRAGQWVEMVDWRHDEAEDAIDPQRATKSPSRRRKMCSRFSKRPPSLSRLQRSFVRLSLGLILLLVAGQDEEQGTQAV